MGYRLLAKAPLSLTGGCSHGDREGGLVTSQVVGGALQALSNHSGTGLRKSAALGLDMALALPVRAEAPYFIPLCLSFFNGERETGEVAVS